MPPEEQLIRVLQTAISPVVLISGVGLLVLSMTNRFARTTDRARALAVKRPGAGELEQDRLSRQIRILYRRSRILLLATSLALTSVFMASLLIMTLFVHYLGSVNLYGLIIFLFVISLATLSVGLLLFIQDMTLSLGALKEELQDQV